MTYICDLTGGRLLIALLFIDPIEMGGMSWQ